MKHKGFSTYSWKTILPSVATWADSVKIETAADFKGALGEKGGIAVVIPVKGDNEKKPSPPQTSILAKCLPASVLKELNESLKELQWSTQGGWRQMIDGKLYCLVPVSSIQTTPAQLGRQFGIDAARLLKDVCVDSLIFADGYEGSSADLIEGLALQFYDIGLFKSERLADSHRKEKLPKRLVFCAKESALSQDEITHVRALAKAQAMARTLQDAPPNWLDPQRFADIAEECAKDFKIKCSIKGRSELHELGMGAFLSVAQGSMIEPRLITLELEGAKGSSHASSTVALVGKGLTFDSGGISIKPSLGMGEMKYDMSGAAAVFGAMIYLSLVKSPVRVVGLIGAVENMPGNAATRPSDVVVAMNGKTIDIQNTDAEGRLVLCDLLHYAVTTFKPKLVLNIATLTGAVLYALGHAGSAVMANGQATADVVLKLAKDCGEPMWQLPLWPELEKEIQGEVSDYCNIAKPNVMAGTIIGGHFLAKFVGKTPWAHLDIAGTGWGCKATGFPTVGGSSFGLKTLARACLDYPDYAKNLG